MPEALPVADPAIPQVLLFGHTGSGKSSLLAALMRAGRFYPDHGLERIVDYHERQDSRFAQAAAQVSERYGKPVLTATELSVTHPDNAGPAAVRATGRTR